VRGAGGTVALRCPEDRLCHALLDFIGGPVVSSSANISGQPTAETAEEVVQIFGNQIDVILDGGPLRDRKPSTLIDVSTPDVRLLRRGAIDVPANMLSEHDPAGG
jgi:tRNA threonylcarbamoyl adenosine modification protein (Sua5/YciO/YrdC/YwlC family)